MADATDDVARLQGPCVFTVPLAKGKKITLSIRDGTT
jgi:hypothetical protein